ncbi:acetyl-CoA acetyltransferase [Denitratisoma oestradiolicum]|uniref:Acetyl-CoA acetyltransferase n=1 Tax=Denitratisoma oestradiolicum TaxID=311182 RepID=A0A6S6XXY3_9PROT|nr:acetyl-CoA acetyltransferase [Denitratisoma oestradiolicum]TWO79976.1 hypothetical protein CBW56_11690 [Denitratisoma oestradiolicum]CAB1369739.1 Acetyl-CoA acetyltransferase [Denitratisoma oestradiolicum]
MHSVPDSTPVIVGVGQHCPRTFDPSLPCAPSDLVAEAARKALADSGQGEALRQAIDTVVFFKLFADMGFAPSPLGRSTKPPRSLTWRLGIDPPQVIYSGVGGNLPQKMVNDYAEAIARGETKTVLLAGGESLRITAEAVRAGIKLDWNEDPPGDMVDLGQGDDMVALDYEFPHGVGLPTWSYPLFENAIRGQKGRTVAQHQKVLGELWAGLNRIALANPLAAAPSAKTAAEMATPGPDNRLISFPYTKVMNANDRVDEAAAVILTSAGTARALGIDPSRWVFLRGCGDAKARMRTTDHIDFHSSPALALCAKKALAQAGIGIDQVDFFDIYSCFPAAVELGCDALGLREGDPRPLTVTGGLPFFGGPGNAYVLHSIAETVEWLRRGRGKYGLVTGNGGFMSKQSVGIYSTEPGTGPWQREDPAVYQAELDAVPSPRVELAPSGPARIETYTVICEKGVPARGVIIGRLLADDARFVANTPQDRPDILQWLMEGEPLNTEGSVVSDKGRNTFVPARFL